MNPAASHASQKSRSAIYRALHPDAASMVLKQSNVWASGMLWTVVSAALAVFVWSCISELDEVIHVVGKLEPRGSAQEIQSPVPGVVSKICVSEGQSVRSGDLLIQLDPKVSMGKVRALEEQLASMKSEQLFYDQISGRATHDPPVPPPIEMADLAKNLASLKAEDSLLRAILNSSEEGTNLSLDQKNLFSEEIKNRLENLSRLNEQLDQARMLETSSKKIFESYSTLAASGAGSKVDLLQREMAWIEAVARIKNLESQQQLLGSQFRKEVLTRLGENTKRIAEIQANLTRAGINNTQRIIELTSRLEEAREDLSYHEIKAPSDGVVFQVVAGKAGHVVGGREVVVRIVPTDELIANVDVTNRDIGFVSTGLPCEVEVDTFPKREFGFLEGAVYFVSSDALPPTTVKRTYSFPAKISLQRQSLAVRGKQVALQSGMSVNANIKVRKRKVINLFLDRLVGPLDRMKEIR